jgi:hypothetical protein
VPNNLIENYKAHHMGLSHAFDVLFRTTKAVSAVVTGKTCVDYMTTIPKKP